MTDQPSEPENHTIRLLQAMRSELNERFNAVDERFNAIDERFEKIEAEISAVHSEVLKMRSDVLETKAIGREVALRLTGIEKRVKELETT